MRDEPCISLMVLMGARSLGYQTIKVYTKLGPHKFIALLDSGSTHNFINVDMVRQAGIFVAGNAGNPPGVI